MIYKRFLKLLTIKEKLLFVIGSILEKIEKKQNGYQQIKAYRNFLADIENQGFDQSLKNEILTLKKNGSEIQLRKYSSDYDVFNQVFLKNEYQPVIDILISNKIKLKNIIDAGSNIGLTTLKLLDYFPNANIICLEPDPENFLQLTTNLGHYKNIILLPNALWNKEETLYLDFSFRDGRDWSRSVTRNSLGSKTSIKGVSINTLLQEYKITSIDFLKIDIEGSESNIFTNENNLSFLDKVKVIAVEIHDEFNCRENIYEILRSKSFRLFNAGELTIGIK